jgi:phage gp46-like protein
MIDLLLAQGSDGIFDLSIKDGDLEGTEGLDTALWVSVFSDQRAPEDRVALPQNRRGWLGDLNSPVVDRLIGCLLWLVDQRRLNQDTLNDAIDFLQSGLQWLQDDGLVQNVSVTGELVPRSGIALTALITTLDGKVDSHYIPLWEATVNA